MSEGLFVYGTLHPDRAPLEIRKLVRRLKPIAEGTVVGALYDLGEYPALIAGGKGGRVHGMLFALPDDLQTLSALDAYEEYFPANREKSLFVREKRMVTLADGKRQRHWVYVYNRALPAGVPSRQQVAA